jgi:nucleoside-diphosphate-sugar epimerase
MRVFVTGATGYIGGSVAARLLAAGHRVTGLTRSEGGAAALRARGIDPVVGSLADGDLLAAEARRADAVVNAANADDRGSVAAMLPAARRFLQTSGTSVIGDKAAGEPTDRVYDEETPFEPHPERAGRHAIDRAVLAAGGVVLCPGLIYGRGLGAHEDSVQVPALIAQAKKSGVPRYVGRGLNVWPTVHVEDVADLYLLALERAPAGAFFFVADREAPMRAIVESISRMLGLGGRAEGWPLPEAVREWGPDRAQFALGSNCRVRATRARALLGWSPHRPSVFEEIERGWYLRQHRGG